MQDSKKAKSRNCIKKERQKQKDLRSIQTIVITFTFHLCNGKYPSPLLPSLKAQESANHGRPTRTQEWRRQRNLPWTTPIPRRTCSTTRSYSTIRWMDSGMADRAYREATRRAARMPLRHERPRTSQ